MLRHLVVVALGVILILSLGVPTGAATSTLGSINPPGPIAVSPSGMLYVASGSTVYKQTSDGFERFAGASGAINSSIVSPAGVLYLGENSRLQAVSPVGVVTTVAHLSVSGLALGPSNSFYVAANDDVFRFAEGKFTIVATPGDFSHLEGVPAAGHLGFGDIAADGTGDLYVSAMGIGYNLYEISHDGHASFVSPFRGGNGKPAVLTSAPNGDVYGAWQTRIYSADGGGITRYDTFKQGSVGDIGGTFLPAFIPASPRIGGPIYADADGENGFAAKSAIIAIYPDKRIATIWRSL